MKMDLKRRKFFQLLGIGGGTMALSKAGKAAESNTQSAIRNTKIAVGVLVDTTKCVGCRSCEAACNEANHLPKPKKPIMEDDSLFEKHRDTSPTAFTVVNRYTPNGKEITRKQQCLHCLEPACSSACIIKAMEKQPTGPVTYREDLCLGCRYCMVACPFDVPKFEYDKAVPLVKKCQFCFKRQQEGKQPACVEACPMGALKFGPREELLEEARTRIYTKPDEYVHQIYGENEAGGTSWMYLAAVPFEQLGLPAGLGKKAYPELTLGAMGVVPMVMILWPALLMGLHQFAEQRDTEESRVRAPAPLKSRAPGKNSDD
jgi:Fe-S-cluster-containing dehydrogenase component